MNTSMVGSLVGTPSTSSRMTLSNVRKGPIQMPMRILLYAAEKVGKSTFAASAPSPIFLGQDSGTEQLDVARMPQPETWKQFKDALDLLIFEAHEYKTLVVDPVNWFESLAYAQVIEGSGKTIDNWDGGYGRGYNAALDLWRETTKMLEQVRAKGMNVVLLGHAHVKTFNDPSGPAYDRYTIAMNDKVSGLLRGWVDAVLFAKVDTYGRIEEKNAKKGKAQSTGIRILHTNGSGAFDAGTRWKWMPPEIALSWDSFTEEVRKSESVGGRVKSILAQIDQLLDSVGDEEYVAKVKALVDKNRDNPEKLVEFANKITLRVSQGAEAKQEEKGESR